MLGTAWDLVTEGAEWWQVERLLADLATSEKHHDVAVARLEALFYSQRWPKSERPKIRRALNYARHRLAGHKMPGDD